MTKNADTRLRETIAFIKNNRTDNFVGLARDFKKLTDLLDDWYQNASAQDHSTLSQLMSQNGSAGRPAGKRERAFRRAAILLKCALAEPPANWARVKAIVNGSSSPEGAYKGGFNQGWDGYWNDPVRAQAQLDRLRADPLHFLRDFRINIYGGNKPAGEQTYGFYMVGGLYKLDCNNPGNGVVRFTAINVPATPYSAVKGKPGKITATHSSDHNKRRLMLTTQFTGCCYCFSISDDEKTLSAAHIDPVKATKTTGQEVWRTLFKKGGFAGADEDAGAFRPFGRLDDSGDSTFGYGADAGYVNIVGVRRHYRWQVFAQTYSDGGNLETQCISED